MTILALIDSEKKDFNGALNQFKKTLDSSISKKSEVWIGITKGNIAYILFQEGKYSESIDFLKEDIKLSLKYNEWGSAMISYLTLKDVYLKLNQPEKSNLYLDSAHLLLKKILTETPFNERYYLNEEFDIHTSEGNRLFKSHDYINASKFYEKAFELQKLKAKEEKEAQIKKVIEGIEIDKNINQINELKEEIKNKKETLIYFIGIIISVFIILLIYIAFYRQLKKANKSLLIKSEIIKHQNMVLEKINNDKDRLFSIISHDLRGPSNNLHLIFKAVADKKLPASTLEEQLPNIVKNSTNLINTLESLLTWSVSQLKGIIANKEKVDIIDSINNNIHFFEDQAQKKSIQLINHCHSKMVMIDKNHIEIILRNFTSNAIKFSKQNSTIEFNQIDHGDHVEISVTDHGSGLTDEQISNIMNSTAMKSVVGTAGEKGIGLGLLLTKEFIEINGGILKIKSQLKEGTTMSFTIPKAI
jgi:signal transduction histidine kinase